MLRPLDQSLIDFEKTYRQIFKQPLHEHQQYTRRQLIYNYAAVGSQFITNLLKQHLQPQKQSITSPTKLYQQSSLIKLNNVNKQNNNKNIQQTNKNKSIHIPIDLQDIIKQWNNSNIKVQQIIQYNHNSNKHQNSNSNKQMAHDKYNELLEQQQNMINIQQNEQQIKDYKKQIQLIKKQKIINKYHNNNIKQRNIYYRKQLQLLFKTRNNNQLNLQSMKSHFNQLKPYISYNSRNRVKKDKQTDKFYHNNHNKLNQQRQNYRKYDNYKNNPQSSRLQQQRKIQNQRRPQQQRRSQQKRRSQQQRRQQQRQSIYLKNNQYGQYERQIQQRRNEYYHNTPSRRPDQYNSKDTIMSVNNKRRSQQYRENNNSHHSHHGQQLRKVQSSYQSPILSKQQSYYSLAKASPYYGIQTQQQPQISQFNQLVQQGSSTNIPYISSNNARDIQSSNMVYSKYLVGSSLPMIQISSSHNQNYQASQSLSPLGTTVYQQRRIYQLQQQQEKVNKMLNSSNMNSLSGSNMNNLSGSNMNNLSNCSSNNVNSLNNSHNNSILNSSTNNSNSYYNNNIFQSMGSNNMNNGLGQYNNNPIVNYNNNKNNNTISQINNNNHNYTNI